MKIHHHPYTADDSPYLLYGWIMGEMDIILSTGFFRKKDKDRIAYLFGEIRKILQTLKTS